MSESERQFAQKDRDLKAALARIQEMEKMHRDEFESLSMRAEDTELRLAESMGAERTLRKRVSELEDEVMATKMEVKTVKKPLKLDNISISLILYLLAQGIANGQGCRGTN